MSQPQRISVDPPDPSAGTTVKVCYEFDGQSRKSATLQITFSPSGSLTKVVTDTEPCVDVAIPPGTDEMSITDVGGPSPDLVVPVT